ncbi:MAG: OmpA family protein [Zoogloeaceae bacterium]|nr:OmpA family protein [Rhodocyclaceae bacterium]MCP5236393.1 OmpA family protein [Zoogloeaceae bacterium]
MNTRKLIATSLIAAFATAAAHAGGEVIYYNADERPDPQTVARILGGAPAQAAPEVRTRSIRMRSIHLIQTADSAPVDTGFTAKPAPSTDEPAQVASEPPAEGLALPVQFAFDSAAIQPSATFQLDAVAEGIRLAGSGVRVMIEGHTDAVGSDDYNRRLSLARAKAVKNYLVYRHGISADQLVVEGLGEAMPIEAGNPFAPRNRRVEFRAARG